MKLKWDQTGERFFEAGTDRGVVYPYADDYNSSEDTTPYKKGAAWNGLTGVSENPSGGEPTPLWADNIKYLNLMSAEDFGATVTAYTYPDEFAECDGSREITTGVTIGQQPRKTFGLSYRTKIGNDTDSTDKGYKLHLVYGCQAAPSQKDYQTINDTPDAVEFSWEITTTPVEVTVNNKTYKPTAHIVIDSTKTDAAKLAALEELLYGSATKDAQLPLPETVYTTLAA